MGIIRNIVIAGDYKGANIKYKAFSEKIILESKGFLGGKDTIELDKKSVRKVEVMSKAQTGVVTDYQVTIYFKNGKKSLAILESLIYNKLVAKLF
ncbi:hypothetical protein Lac2_23330 [Claveliimonas bilis]|uniref:hypothetical protein n=1 Tax=Claveliimonas bilis TaxID=3028070 RepID=UPI00292EA14F|nr:hypothetical protein [Claveliimonas bilis]BDZ84199.1 hypothetical protein Lac2_23330 [Claveliimonas bilis]